MSSVSEPVGDDPLSGRPSPPESVAHADVTNKSINAGTAKRRSTDARNHQRMTATEERCLIDDQTQADVTHCDDDRSTDELSYQPADSLLYVRGTL